MRYRYALLSILIIFLCQISIADATKEKREIKAIPESFISPTLGAKFVLIPAGTFTMGGSGTGERQRQVTISKPFYMQTTEVTQGQWKQVMGRNPSNFTNCGDDCPVESVSWNDVQIFINKLNRMEKTVTYRLPIEAEWEYAARAGTTTEYSFGNSEDNLATYAWYDKNAGNQTHPVGQKMPNAWGLYDMHGNVWEMCQDWKKDYPPGSVMDPTGPKLGGFRVDRGGSWGNGASFCRSAYRGVSNPDLRNYRLGFRLAKTP